MGFKKVPLDEIELHLGLLKAEVPEMFPDATSAQIAEAIKSRYGIECNERDIFLLHEPTISEDMQDSEYFYRQVLGIY